jgi:hypothetical protein
MMLTTVTVAVEMTMMVILVRIETNGSNSGGNRNSW